MATVYSIVYSPQKGQPDDHYNRVPLKQANLVENFGIEGDAKGGKHPDRNLNIMCHDMLNGLGNSGLNVEPGAMGEQMIFDGLNVMQYPPKTRIQIGDSAVIELTKPRTGCDRFQAIQGVDPKTLENQMGMMARVIVSGAINVGDEIKVLED